MSKIYSKWRDSKIDIMNIDFKIDKIISYPPAGNEVYEILSDDKSYFIKVERSKMADFESEYRNIKILKMYYNKIPNIVKYGEIDNSKFLILSKIEGERLSDLILENKVSSKDIYEKYGRELGILHKVPIKEFSKAKERSINKITTKNTVDDIYISEIIKYLQDNEPLMKYNTLIHGDFHYTNLLWKDNEVSGVIDFEYSGVGFKEQDIAWALILRPSQSFKFTIEEINSFIKGYNSENSFNYDYFKWCYINGTVHFYLMNNDNEEYKDKLRKLIEII